MFATALNEIDPEPLKMSSSNVLEFHENGYVHVPAVFTHAEISALRQLLDDASANNLGFREDKHGGFFSFRGLTLSIPTFAGLACTAKVLGPIVQLLGPHIRFLGIQSITRQPIGDLEWRTRENSGWHRDIFGMSRDLGSCVPRCALKYAIYISSSEREDAGGTRFLPGSHRRDKIELLEGQLDPNGWIAPRAKPGDVVIFENRMFHSGGMNRSSNSFRLLLLQYGFRWLAPVLNVRHDASILDVCSDLCRQVLDADDCVEGAYRPDLGSRWIAEWANRHDLLGGPRD